MVYRTTGQKIEICTRFIVGLRHTAAVAALRPYGFSEAVLEEGWKRMTPVVTKLPPDAEAPPAVLLRELESFQDTWFPVVRGSLGASYPQLGEALFAGLQQERSQRVVLSVAAFLDRLGAAQAALAPYGAAGPQALELLAERGLTTDLLARARALIAELTHVSMRQTEVEAYDQEQRRALDHAWAWYLEWSAIARVAIKNKTLLFALGLRARKSAGAAEEQPAQVPALHSPALPSPALPSPAISVRLLS